MEGKKYFACLDLTPWQEKCLVDAGCSIKTKPYKDRTVHAVGFLTEQLKAVEQIIEKENILAVKEGGG